MKTVLLVHHSRSFLERNSALLSRLGILTLTASTATEALAIFQMQPVDLVISVLEMPEMGGDALCRTIRNSATWKVPFILVCYDFDPEVKRALISGADACLVKPVRPELLLEMVGRFLRQPVRRHRDYSPYLSGAFPGAEPPAESSDPWLRRDCA
jgi:CheY-like chemotaxis protein